MARAVVLTVDQAKTLRSLDRVGCMSAMDDSERSVLEQCVNRGWATKQQNGTGVTYTINGYGKTILRSL